MAWPSEFVLGYFWCIDFYRNVPNREVRPKRFRSLHLFKNYFVTCILSRVELPNLFHLHAWWHISSWSELKPIQKELRHRVNSIQAVENYLRHHKWGYQWLKTSTIFCRSRVLEPLLVTCAQISDRTARDGHSVRIHTFLINKRRNTHNLDGRILS